MNAPALETRTAALVAAGGTLGFVSRALAPHARAFTRPRRAFEPNCGAFALDRRAPDVIAPAFEQAPTSVIRFSHASRPR
jgi:hypothetical protein